MLVALPDSSTERAAALEDQLLRRFLGVPAAEDLITWAERERHLPATDGGGMWKVERVPYLREPLMALSDPRTQEIAAKKSAQSGGSIGILLNWLLYSIAVDPCNILLLYPTQGEAEKFSKKKFTPAYEAAPALRGLIADSRSRKGDNTTLEKSFPGGSLGIIGGVSSRGLRMVDARRYAGDDIDSLDHSTDEGDQIYLLRQRAAAQWNAQGVWISSPGAAHSSKITQLYEEMERRGRFHIACPHCGHRQVLRFGDEDSPYGLKWDRQVGLAGTTRHYPETAAYLCEGCSALIEEKHKYSMVQAGMYLTEDGEPVYDGTARSYGFWWNALVSFFPRVSWPNIVDAWLKSRGDPSKRKVVVNTILAETYDEVETELNHNDLEGRAERYAGSQGERVEVPDGVGVLVAFADVQHDRIELVVRGYGDREESWQILHQRIHGDTDRGEVFAQLDSWRTKSYRHASGSPLRILAMGIDSGDGTRVEQVYRYALQREREGVWATKGSSDRNMKEPLRISKKTKERKVRILNLNTYALKSTLFARLRKHLQPGKDTPYGYYHFRAADSEWHNGSDAEYFAQFGRERPRKKRLPGTGRIVVEWVKSGANEAIDLEAGCLGMLRLLQQLDVRYRDNLFDFAAAARKGGSGKSAVMEVGPQRRGRRMVSGGVS